MRRNVITIARTIGAGGEEIGVRIAKSLNFRYVDDEIIVKAAQMAGVSTDEAAEAEHTASLLARILESIGRSSMVEETMVVGIVGEDLADYYNRPRFEALIPEVVQSVAKDGNVVLVAHGGGFALGASDTGLRVLVTASPEVRAARLVRERNLSQREALKAVHYSDRQRQAYLKRFYGRPQELNTNYDLVINTDTVDYEAAAAIIVSLAGAEQRERSYAGER